MAVTLSLRLWPNHFIQLYLCCEVSVFAIQSFYSNLCTNHSINIFPMLLEILHFLKVEAPLKLVGKCDLPHFALPLYTLA